LEGDATMPDLLEQHAEEPEGSAGLTRELAPSGTSGGSAVIVLVLIAIVVGIVAGLIGANMGDDPNDPDVRAERGAIELEAAVNARISGTTPPEPRTWPRPWPAENALLFGAGVGLAVFVVGLLVIIANNTSRRS
jgi:hypothetical protein